MRLRILALLAVLIAAPSAAFAADVGPQDGNTYGGSAYRLECHGNGQNQAFLYGMSGMIGSWVDKVGAECADWVPGQGWSNAWNARGKTGTVGSSGGGGPQSAICPPGTLVKGFAYTFAVPDRTYMQNITLQCVDPLAPFAVHSEQPELRSDNGDAPYWGHKNILDIFAPFHSPGERWHALACPGDLVATGIQGGAGTFVDWIGLICGAPPTAPASSTASAPRPIHITAEEADKLRTHRMTAEEGVVLNQPPASAPIPGSWYQSCSNASLYQNVLTASCKSTTGLDVTSSLDVTTCNQPPSAANINGRLVCQNGTASGASSSGGYGGGPSGGSSTGGAASGGSAVPPSPVIEGDWNSSEGAMTLEQDGKQLEGSYNQDAGRIHAKRENGVWRGIWSESKSDHRCNDDRLGTHYWGLVEFSFSNQNRHFDGQWTYCGSDFDGSHPWTGDRIK